MMAVSFLRDCKLRNQVGKIIIFGLIALVVLAWTRYGDYDASSISSFRVRTKNAIHNETLGVCPPFTLSHHPLTAIQFEQILVLTLPGRDDRLVPLVDAANATGLTFSSFHAVRDTEVADSELSNDWNRTNHGEGVLGCLASHVRAWQQ